MPEENENIEDFVSLWKKKLKTEPNKPSAIGETLDKLKELNQENEVLRNKIKENIDLITKTEQVFKTTMQENERLKEELNQAGMIGGVKASDLLQQNQELNNKIQNLISNFAQKEKELTTANNQINELYKRIQTLSAEQESTANSSSQSIFVDNNEVIKNLKSELSEKNLKILELQNINKDLVQKNDQLKSIKKGSSIKGIDTAMKSTVPLEKLCKDLQVDLNKYKKIVDQLKIEKSELERNIRAQKDKPRIEKKKLKEFEQENEELKKELTKIQNSLQQKTNELNSLMNQENLKGKVKELEHQLKEKDIIITELKSTSKIAQDAQKIPMSNLLNDLQNTIIKLKLTIEEKNKLIEELKSK